MSYHMVVMPFDLYFVQGQAPRDQVLVATSEEIDSKKKIMLNHA